VGNDAYIALCDHIFWSNDAPRENRDFHHGDIVFCKIDEVWRLFRALRRTRKRIVLVTAEGDKPVTPELYAQKPPHVAQWFGTNMFTDTPDTTPLPLGLGREGCPSTLDWKDIQAAASSAPPREQLLYANFGTASNPPVREPLQAWLNEPAQSWITREAHAAAGKSPYLQNLLSHRFVLCPPGNGEDTHRMWEALYCGAIPVVRESPAMRNFRDLPILSVPWLDHLSEEFLCGQLAARTQRRFSREKLGVDYWKAEFSGAQQAACLRGPVGVAEWTGAWIHEAVRMATRGRQA